MEVQVTTSAPQAEARAVGPGLTRHFEAESSVEGSAEAVFTHVDSPLQLSSHMNQSSWKMGWGKMETVLDEDKGQKVGSKIRFQGRILGVSLSVDEVVVERNPPHQKAWETIDLPRLLVIGRYRMGFEILPRGRTSTLRVFIDYSLPASVGGRLLGALFGGFYARWCTRQMIADTVGHFRTAAFLFSAFVGAVYSYTAYRLTC